MNLLNIKNVVLGVFYFLFFGQVSLFFNELVKDQLVIRFICIFLKIIYLIIYIEVFFWRIVGIGFLGLNCKWYNLILKIVLFDFDKFLV